MSKLNRQFWKETLQDIRGLIPTRNQRVGAAKAAAAAARAAEAIDWAHHVLNIVEIQLGVPIPHESSRNENDEVLFEILCLKYHVSKYEGYRETEIRILDKIYSLICDINQNIIIDNSFNEDVFFLLYRLIEFDPLLFSKSL